MPDAQFFALLPKGNGARCALDGSGSTLPCLARIRKELALSVADGAPGSKQNSK